MGRRLNHFETTERKNTHVLMEDNHRYLSSISTLKSKLKEAHDEFESPSKYVKMLTSGRKNLDNILSDEKSRCGQVGLGFFEICSTSTKSSTVFVRAFNADDGTSVSTVCD